MARSIGMAADATVYRAVITKQHRDGEIVTSHEGPYWVNYLAIRDDDTQEPTGESRASGYVEQGTVSWERVR